MRTHAAVIAALLMVVALSACSSSRGTREPWVYGLSRGAYDSLYERPSTITAPADESQEEGFAKILAVFLILPFAVDTALLPITFPHDLLLVD